MSFSILCYIFCYSLCTNTVRSITSLLKAYDDAVSDSCVLVLDYLSEDDKYMVRLSEEEKLLERIEIAKKLLYQNMDIIFISSITGLSEKEIELLN